MKRTRKKAIFLLISCILAVLCFAGCPQNLPLPTPEQTQPATAAPEQTQPSTQPAATQPAEALQIVTNGGVVLVGTVEQDEQGWYLTPEQPLDVSYAFFDEPSVFPGVTRINLFDSREDGVEKGNYLGRIVTVEGSFSFYRDYFDRLYLVPYRITLGKTVDRSYADPELLPPQAEDRYDPSLPLPEQMQLTCRDGRYVFNPYILSQETLRCMGNGFADFFVELVDAVLQRRPTCPCPDRDYAEILTTVLFYELPLYGACCEPFVFIEHYDPQTRQITIPYKYGPQEHAQTVERFLAAADALLAETAPDQSQQKLAQNIYHAMCTRMTYDYSALEDLSRKDAYYAYLEHSGVCITFANTYNQLLAQVGIEATVATCDYDVVGGHAWSMIRVDGQWYFCDPTFELNRVEGQAYFYFGMSYALFTDQGLGKELINYGRYTATRLDPEMLSEKHLQL